jgi:hypothetical protein
MELQVDFNPGDCIKEIKLKLGLSKLKLANKNNPQNMKEIT